MTSRLSKPHTNDSLKIVIADDDRAARELLQTLLRQLGHEVVGMSENGQSLIAACCAKRPDVVITDNFMSDMTGLDAVLAIYEKWPIPIILVSAYCDPAIVRDAENRNVLFYLVKPISKQGLDGALTRCREHLTESTKFFDSELEEVLIEPFKKSETDSRLHIQ